ncbi:MAG: hypothetical protein ACXWJ8_06200 [Xanthobacteraceae bacterium]
MSELEMDPAKFPAPAKALYDVSPRGAAPKAKASAGRIWRCSTIRRWPNGSRRSASI